MSERPVTGSCEQCGRLYDLLIPEPGSGDLDVGRVKDVFGWCAECAQFVGRACCWGPGHVCARCAQRDPPTDAGGSGFAELAVVRAAVRQLDAASVGFSALEAAIDAVGAFDLDVARGAWEDAWLAAGALRTRIDSSREAANDRLRSLNPELVAEARELEIELRVLTTAYEARWALAIAGLTEAGMRLSKARDAAAPIAQAPVAAPAAAVPVAVALPVRAPERVMIRVMTPDPVATPAPAGTALAAASAPPPPAARASTPANSAVSPAIHHVPEGAIPAPQAPEPPEPRVATERAPRTRGLSLTLFAVGVLVLVIGGGVLAGALDRIGSTDDVPANGDNGLPLGGNDDEGSGTPGFTGPSVGGPDPAATATSALDPVVLGFDLHPVGPLSAEHLPVTRIIGVPEIASFPSPFDRSLHLSGEAAGICVEAPRLAGDAAARSTMFDVYLAEAGSGGRLAIGLAATDDAPAVGLRLELATLADLPADAWYRLDARVEGGVATLRVTVPAGGSDVLESVLAFDPLAAPPSADEGCLQASLPEADTFVRIDNLRIDR